jgi:hypothetical protein
MNERPQGLTLVTNESEEQRELDAMQGCVPVVGETFELLGTTYECTLVEWDRDDHEIRVTYGKKYNFNSDPMVKSEARKVYGGDLAPYDKDKANPLAFIPQRPIKDNPQA